MIDLHLAVPPNIARKTADDLRKNFPQLDIRPHQTHAEMDDFFRREFGKPEQTADLTLTAYPWALSRLVAMDDPGQVFAPMPRTLPALRSDLAELGLAEINPYYRVTSLVCFVFIAHKDVSPFPLSWADLCEEDICDAVAVPPEATPAFALYSYFQNKFNGRKGQEAAQRANTSLLPQEINLAVDAGKFKAGVLLSAFGRMFRHGNARTVWPKEGALALPLLAFIKKDVPQEVLNVLHTLFSPSFQHVLAGNGGLVPVHADVDFPSEVTENNCHIEWMGWEDFTTLKKTDS